MPDPSRAVPRVRIPVRSFAALAQWPAALAPTHAFATATRIELRYRTRVGLADVSLTPNQRSVSAPRSNWAEAKTRALHQALRAQMAVMSESVHARLQTMVEDVMSFEHRVHAGDAAAVEEWARTRPRLRCVLALADRRWGDALAATYPGAGSGLLGSPTLGLTIARWFVGRGIEARDGIVASQAQAAVNPALRSVAVELGDAELALDVWRRGLDADRWEQLIAAAGLALEVGELGWAARAATRVLDLDPNEAGRDDALDVLVRTGELEAALAYVERIVHDRDVAADSLRLLAARWCNWAARPGDAKRWSNAVHDPDALRFEWDRETIAAAILTGDVESASARLAALHAIHPDDQELALWRAECEQRTRTGAGEKPYVLCPSARAILGEHPIAALLDRLACIDWNVPDEKVDLSHRALARRINGVADISDPPQSRDAERALLWRALGRFGGNRSPTPTLLDPEGIPRVSPLAEVQRTQAVREQHRLLHRPVEDVRAALASLHEADGTEPFGLTYAAELDLWTGEYERAARSFESIWRSTHTRWGYVGWGAALCMLGRPEHALAAFDEGATSYAGEIDGEATPAYRGECLLRLGRLSEARDELTRACELRPTRIGAWAVRAQVHRALGDDELACVCRDRVFEASPVLAWEASRIAQGAPSWPVPEAAAWAVLDTALKMMRGNRSSHLLTFVDSGGLLRVAPCAGHLDTVARVAAKFRSEAVLSEISAELNTRWAGLASQTRSEGRSP